MIFLGFVIGFAAACVLMIVAAFLEGTPDLSEELPGIVKEHAREMSNYDLIRTITAGVNELSDRTAPDALREITVSMIIKYADLLDKAQLKIILKHCFDALGVTSYEIKEDSKNES